MQNRLARVICAWRPVDPACEKHGMRTATVGLFASVLFAACGWYLTSSIGARLPIQLPVPASWKQQTPIEQAPVVPAIDNEVVNQPDAMHQLYLMWGMTPRRTMPCARTPRR